jgi:TolB protein
MRLLLKSLFALTGLVLTLIGAGSLVVRPALAGDHWIAFTSDRNGATELYRMWADGSQQTRLTHSAAYEISPGWSPFGLWIVYGTGYFEQETGIYMVSYDGSQHRTLARGFRRSVRPVWMPASSTVIYAANLNGQPRLFAQSMGRDAHEILMDFPQTISNGSPPAWSPQRDRIAFRGTQGGNTDIYVMNVDGSDLRSLTRDIAFDSSPAWSPDGEWLVWVSSRGGDWDIYKARPDGSQLTQITDDPAIDSYPSYSPDGEWLAFASNRGGNWDIYRMRPDGTQIQQLTDDPNVDSAPSWSPSLGRPLHRAVIIGVGCVLMGLCIKMTYNTN